MSLKKVPGYQCWADESGRLYIKKKGELVRRSEFHRNRAEKRGNYMSVWVKTDKGTYTTRNVHALVALAFYGKPKKRQICRHLDGNMFNNHPDNLRWGTYKENALDRFFHGTTLLGTGSGSSFDEKGQKWLSHIMYQKNIYLGSYDTKDEANAAYVGALTIVKEMVKQKIFLKKGTRKGKRTASPKEGDK